MTSSAETKRMDKNIFVFLKYCLGNGVDMSGVVAGMDWRQLFVFSVKQALVGFCFDGIERLGREYPSLLKENPVGEDLVMVWMGKAMQIRRKNMKVNVTAAKLYRQLREDGLRCCMLKGQGNALMYPNPYSRNPGDIDVWVKGSRERIAAFAQEHYGWKDEMRYHHLETKLDGVPIELHFLPCTMNNPIYNARLQKWFKRNGDLPCSNVVSLPDGAGEIAVPTASFNVIYQLCHLYHHFFDEGIGLRQMIDYYYVLGANTESTENTDSSFFTTNRTKQRSAAEGTVKFKANTDDTDKTDILWSNTNRTNQTNGACALERELKHLGLWKFAGAVMWVLHEVLGMPEALMIAPRDEKRGKLLLSEILDGGNFGKHAEKYGHFTQQGMAKKYFLKIWRNMHFVRYYPAEALSEPVFRTWHFFWRASHG